MGLEYNNYLILLLSSGLWLSRGVNQLDYRITSLNSSSRDGSGSTRFSRTESQLQNNNQRKSSLVNVNGNSSGNGNEHQYQIPSEIIQLP